MGDRWGPEGPPPEAYERVTNPERFAPLHDIAREAVDRLEAEYDVVRVEAHDLEPEFERDPAQPSVRLVPSDPDAGHLTVVFTRFPGVRLRAGHWYDVSIPSCGCDACDETVEEGQNELDNVVNALVSGLFSEWIETKLIGDPWYFRRVGESGGASRLDRARAKVLLARSDGQTRFDYAPWPRKRPASVG